MKRCPKCNRVLLIKYVDGVKVEFCKRCDRKNTARWPVIVIK